MLPIQTCVQAAPCLSTLLSSHFTYTTENNDHNHSVSFDESHTKKSQYHKTSNRSPPLIKTISGFYYNNLLLPPACIRDPAFTGDPASSSIKTLSTCHTTWVITFLVSTYTVHNCSYHRPYNTKHVYRYFLFHQNSGYDVFTQLVLETRQNYLGPRLI